MRDQVLNIGKALLELDDYQKFITEYSKIEKYICRLKVNTQVEIVLKNITD